MPNAATPAPPRSHTLRQAVRWAAARPMLCAAVFFLFSFALRMLCNSRMGPMVLTIQFDESRYLHLARSIAAGGPLTVWGDPTDFQKILYPLLISPAFLLAKDPLAQMKLVGVINCLLMSSMVFPVALLTKRLTPKPSVLLLTLAFTVALPDFTYTATIMSEPLYWPLSIWAFTLFHEAMAEKEQRKRLLWFALFGAVTYLAYLTKEVALAYLIAAAAMLIFEAIRGRRKWMQIASALASSAAVFFALFLILKLTVFRGMGNSYTSSLSDYDHLSLDVLRSPDIVYRLFFSTAALMLAAILSFYVLPVLLPLFHFKTMDSEKQRIYLFSMLSLALTAGAIAYTASIRVYTWSRMSQLYLRMLAPMAVPFAILCFDILASKDNAAQRKKATKRKKPRFNKKTVLLLTVVFCALPFILLPIVPEYENLMDHASLAITNVISIMRGLANHVSAGAEVWFAYKAFFAVFTAAGGAFYLNQKRRPLLALLLCAVCAISVADNSSSYRMIRLQKIPNLSFSHLDSQRYLASAIDILYSGQTPAYTDRLADAAVAVNGFLQQLDHAPEDAVVASMETLYVSYLWTYSPPNLRLYALHPEDELQYLTLPGRLPVRDLNAQTVNYLVVTEEFNPFANVEVLFERAPFVVLRNLDPSGFSFVEESGYPLH